MHLKCRDKREKRGEEQMILSRKLIKKIEGHFYQNQEERQLLDTMVQEIAEQICTRLDETGVKTRNFADTTANKAARIEREANQLKKWIQVVKKTYERFLGTPYAQLMRMVYEDKESPTKVQCSLFISEATFFKWKADIILYAALKACE